MVYGAGYSYAQRRAASPVVAALLDELSSRKVDFVGIGDSNQLLGGLGWDHGFQKFLSDNYEMYSTGLLSLAENNFNGSGTGYGYGRGGATFTGAAITGAPASLDDHLDKGLGSLGPHDYLYVPNGSASATSYNNGITTSTGGPLDVAANLKFQTWWGSFDSDSGSFKPTCRLGVSPWTLQATASLVSTNTGSLGDMAVEELSIPASEGRVAVQCSLNQIGSVAVTGPFFGTYYRIVNADIDYGFSYNTLNFHGGGSVKDMAYDLQQMSDASLTHYFTALRYGNSERKSICFIINSGVNDRTEADTSVGVDAVADGDSPEAFADNLSAIVARMKAIWSANSWDFDEVSWVFLVSHPVSDPDDAELVLYREAAASYAASIAQAVAIDITDYFVEGDFLTNSWYASGGADRNHLTQAGYEGVAAGVFE